MTSYQLAKMFLDMPLEGEERIIKLALVMDECFQSGVAALRGTNGPVDQVHANPGKLEQPVAPAESEKDECAIIIHKATIKVTEEPIRKQLEELLANRRTKMKVRNADIASGYIGPFSQLSKEVMCNCSS